MGAETAPKRVLCLFDVDGTLTEPRKVRQARLPVQSSGGAGSRLAARHQTPPSALSASLFCWVLVVWPC